MKESRSLIKIRLLIQGNHVLVRDPGNGKTDTLGLEVGIHDVCGAVMKWFKNTSSLTHTIWCTRCQLRVEIPSTITTYTSLKAWVDDQALAGIDSSVRLDKKPPHGEVHG